MLLNTKKKQNKFIISMIIIIGCATLINYSIFTLLSTYYFTTGKVSESIILMGMIIGITSILMFILIPKETAENVSKMLENDYENVEKTPDQELMDMVDDDEDLKL